MEASFEYTAPSAQTRAMDTQLRSLGGSDVARVGEAGIWVRVAPPVAPQYGQQEPETAVGVDERVVVVRDPREPIDAPTDQSYRRFRVSGTFGTDASQTEVHDAIGAPEVDWLFDGFNSTYVAFGEVGTGKTYTLFGGAGGERSWQDGGLCGNVITELFQRVEAAEPGSYAVGISCWEVLNSDTFDLLAYPVANTTSANPSFINVRVNSRAAALKVLERARVGSQSWEYSNVDTDSEPFVALPNAGHSFVRLTLINVAKRRCSTLHMVDLAGSQSLDHRTAPRAFEVTAETAKARKNINQQLLAFSRVIQEMADVNAGAGATEASQAKLISARDSRLTQILGPIMGQNCRTIFLATVSAELDHYSDTIATLRTASRVVGIASPCVPTTLLPAVEHSARAGATGFPLDEMLCQSAGMVPLQQVLSVRMINEISHLDSSVQSIQSSAPSAVTARSGPSSVSASSDGGSSTTGGGTSIKSQMQKLREYMATTYPGAPVETETAALPPSAQPSENVPDRVNSERANEPEDQGQTQSPAAKKRRTPARDSAKQQFEAAGEGVQASSRHFQREFEQISREMEQAEAQAKKMGMTGGSNDIREQFRSNFGDLSDSLHRGAGAQPAAGPEPEPAKQLSGAEDNTLRMNYESLLSVLREVEMEKGRLENHVEELHHELAEVKMQHELDIDTKRVEVIELQSKLRKAAGRAGFGEVFDKFEQQIELLQKEIEQLREANVSLERQTVFGKVGGFAPGDILTDEDDNAATSVRYSARAGAHEKRAEMVSRKVQQELQALRKENAELKKKERTFALHQKGFEDASKKIGKLSKEIGAREAQLRSEAIVTEEYERRIWEMEALVNDAKEREEQIHAGYHATFKENEELKQRMRKMRGDLGAQTHTRARSTYGKVASAAGLNVFEHCKRLERDLPSSSRCLSNFQRVLKAIDKQDRELVAALDREQEMLELIREYEAKSRETFRELCAVHQRVFSRPPSQRVLADLAAAMGGAVGAPNLEGRA